MGYNEKRMRRKDKMEKEQILAMNKIERKIYLYLERHSAEEFNVVAIAKAVKHGYPAVLKYVSILEAKGLIKVVDFGNNKRVSFGINKEVNNGIKKGN